MSAPNGRSGSPPSPWLDHLVATLGRRLIGSRFLGGETVRDALAVAAAVSRNDASTAFLPLFAVPASEAEAWNQAAIVHDLIRSASAEGLDVQILLEPDLFGWRTSPGLACRLLEDVCRVAGECGGFVHLAIAAEDGGPAAGSALFERLSSTLGHSLGLSMAADLAGAEDVLRRVAGRGHHLLLWDPARAPGRGAARGGRDCRTRTRARQRYLDLARLHWQGGGYLAASSRDTSLLHALEEAAAQEGVPDSRYEFVFLMGDRVRQQRAFQRAGRAVRILIPFGDAWREYLGERLEDWPWDVDLSLWRLFG